MPNDETPKIKAIRKPYFGIWAVGVSGNLPVAIFHPDVKSSGEEWANKTFGKEWIGASISAEEFKLVTRRNIQSLKTIVVERLKKLLLAKSKNVP